MPIYEYRCEEGHNFEVEQKITEPPLSQCKVCHASCYRVISPVGIMFKGSGFHVTDYGGEKSKPSAKKKHRHEPPKKPDKPGPPKT